MIIDLDPTTRIRGTEKAWQLERETIFRGESKWKGIGYFGSFAAALKAAFALEVRTSGAHGVEEALAEIERIFDKYRSVMDDFRAQAE